MSDNHTLAEHMPALPFSFFNTLCFNHQTTECYMFECLRYQESTTSKFVVDRNIEVDIRLPKTLTEVKFQLCLKWKREHAL